MQPRHRVIGHADHTAPTRRRVFDHPHADHTYTTDGYVCPKYETQMMKWHHLICPVYETFQLIM